MATSPGVSESAQRWNLVPRMDLDIKRWLAGAESVTSRDRTMAAASPSTAADFIHTDSLSSEVTPFHISLSPFPGRERGHQNLPDEFETLL